MADYSGLTDLPIDAGFLKSRNWESELSKPPHIQEFRDGVLIYAVMLDYIANMQLIHRTQTEYFRDTVNRFVAGNSLAISGCFADLGSFGYIWRAGNDPMPPDLLAYMGFNVEGGRRFGETRPWRAYLAFNQMGGTRFSVGIGDPPANVYAATSGLCPVIINRLVFPCGYPGFENTDQWFRDLVNRGDRCGNCFVALSSAQPRATGTDFFRLILVAVKPDNEGPRPLLDVRKALIKADFQDVILTDGSDSVFWNFGGKWRIVQGKNKNRIVSVGLGFTV